jgi:hypothetical protein
MNKSVCKKCYENEIVKDLFQSLIKVRKAGYNDAMLYFVEYNLTIQYDIASDTLVTPKNGNIFKSNPKFWKGDIWKRNSTSLFIEYGEEVTKEEAKTYIEKIDKLKVFR